MGESCEYSKFSWGNGEELGRRNGGRAAKEVNLVGGMGGSLAGGMGGAAASPLHYYEKSKNPNSVVPPLVKEKDEWRYSPTIRAPRFDHYLIRQSR